MGDSRCPLIESPARAGPSTTSIQMCVALDTLHSEASLEQRQSSLSVHLSFHACILMMEGT